MALSFDPELAAVAHRPVYRRIDPMHPGRRPVITAVELMQSGGREPDPAVYHHDPLRDVWILKDGV